MSKFTRKIGRRGFTCYVEKTRLPGSENADNLISFRGKIVPLKTAMDILDAEFCEASPDSKARDILDETYEVYENFMIPIAKTFFEENLTTKDSRIFIALQFLSIANKDYEICFGDWKAVGVVTDLEKQISLVELHDFWNKVDKEFAKSQAWNPTKIRLFLKSGSNLETKKGEEWQQTKVPLSTKSKKVLNDSASAPL